MQNQPIHTQATPETLVSFIIPVYNVPADMLRECIGSICRLSLRDYEREIIVVDDGSKRSPLNDLDDLADQLIYVRQRNGGLSRARNRGLQNATGQYIQFIDGDDMLITNLYEHCLDIIRFQHSDMVMFDFCRKKTDQKTYNDLPVISGNDLMRHHNIKATACGYLFKASILGNLRFTPDILHEDEEFTPLLLLRAETIIQTDAPAYFYRERKESITKKDDLRNTLKRLNDFKDIIFRLNKMSDTTPGLDRLALQRRTAQLTMDYIYNVIVLTQSRHYLDRRLDELRTKGLFPLPDHDYTTKYKWFRRMTNSNIGIMMLMRTLPLMKRER